MALANHRVRTFPDIIKLESFIRNDTGIATIVGIFQDNSGGFILVFTVSP